MIFRICFLVQSLRQFCFHSAILITGWKVGPYLRSAEIYLPSTNIFCFLPDLPEWRVFHTQDGPWACGGLGSRHPVKSQKSCDYWSEGSWSEGYRLREWKIGHVSWVTASGLYLMGGYYTKSKMTSELVKEDGSVEEGFKLQYETA